MHKVDARDRETAAVSLYMDESGSLDPGTPEAVVGGILINRSHFLPFEERWDEMLHRYGIEPPLHMKEFAPDKRLGYISKCCREKLFSEVAYLINAHKIASLTATLSNSEYTTLFDAELRKDFSVYGMCFSLALLMNHQLATLQNYKERIPFIMDAGNPHAEHVRQAHAEFLRMQREDGFLHAGGLYFGDDTEFGVLQAADVIAWGYRRISTHHRLPPGMEIISGILWPENGHNQERYKGRWLKTMSERSVNKLAEAKTKASAAQVSDDYA